MDEEIHSAWNNKKRLRELLEELTDLKLFDLAGGAGNFLVVAYKELRGSLRYFNVLID